MQKPIMISNEHEVEVRKVNIVLLKLHKKQWLYMHNMAKASVIIHHNLYLRKMCSILVI